MPEKGKRESFLDGVRFNILCKVCDFDCSFLRFGHRVQGFELFIITIRVWGSGLNVKFEGPWLKSSSLGKFRVSECCACVGSI